MRKSLITALLLAATAMPAHAGDKPLFAPAPAWVAPAPPLGAKSTSDAPNFLPLFDEQVKVEGDTATVYIDAVRYVASAEMLNMLGTVTLAWNPAHGDLTIHRLEIVRGDQHIDLLGDKPEFTILRREAGLERLMVDGQLTAVKHIEGLQVGDMLRMTISISEADAVLGGKVQAMMFLAPKPVKIGFGRARMVWPQAEPLKWKILQSGIEAAPKPIEGGMNELTIPLPSAKLPDLPGDIPSRFQQVPMVVASTFSSWEEVSAVMAPHYRTEGTIAPGSDLAKAVDAIAAKEKDPVRRMAAALQMVQDDVRYQLIALGTGNYKPQAPADTWQKRFGDCKAKTMLLLAVLNRLGITAEPVMANSSRGDAVDTMPASPMAFDHVFVRAEIAGESFWLDGTSLGARLADIRDVPRMGKVLPIRPGGAGLLDLPVRANARPAADAELTIDETAGPHFPAPFTLKVRYAGSWAAMVRVKEDADAEEKLTKYAESMANTWTGSTTIGKPVAVYDPRDATWTVSVDGVAYPDWTFRDGHYEVAYNPAIKIQFDPDRSRGTWQQIPALIGNPWTAHAKRRILLPDGGAGVSADGTDPAHLALPAVVWDRKIARQGSSVIEEVSVAETGKEVAPAEISQTKKTISDAMDRAFVLRLPDAYPHRWDDITRRASSPALARVKAVFDQRVGEKPDEAERLDDRGWLETRLFDWGAAEADYSRAIAIDQTAERLLKRADMRAKLGRHDDALKDVQAAYDIDSGNGEVRYRLAELLAKAGKGDEAIALTETDPDVLTDEGRAALSTRIDILEQADRHGQAMEELDAALDKRPSAADLRNARCWFKGLRDEDLDQALEDCNRAIELASNPAGYLDSRAMVHFRAGRLKEALVDLDAALAIEPELAPTHFMRAVILGRQDDPAGAARELAAARRLDPEIEAFFGRFGIKP